MSARPVDFVARILGMASSDAFGDVTDPLLRLVIWNDGEDPIAQLLEDATAELAVIASLVIAENGGTAGGIGRAGHAIDVVARRLEATIGLHQRFVKALEKRLEATLEEGGAR